MFPEIAGNWAIIVCRYTAFWGIKKLFCNIDEWKKRKKVLSINNNGFGRFLPRLKMMLNAMTLHCLSFAEVASGRMIECTFELIGVNRLWVRHFGLTEINIWYDSKIVDCPQSSLESPASWPQKESPQNYLCVISCQIQNIFQHYSHICMTILQIFPRLFPQEKII